MEKILADRYYKCFFTGHRVIGADQSKISQFLENEMENLVIEYGIDSFICGGAVGFDMMAAIAAVRIKEKYPWVTLELYIPCHEHYIKWKQRDLDMWRSIAARADKVKYITDGPYEKGCMQKRNMAMVRDAHYCIAYCVNESSGTGMTLRFARQNSCDILNIAEYI